MNLTEMMAEAGRLLNDPNNQRWTTDVLTARFNMAQTIVQNYANSVKTRETLTFTADTQELSLNANTMDILEVVVTRQNGDKFPLQGTTLFDLDFNYPGWRNLDSGDPQTWYYDQSNQQLNFVPKPDSNNVVTNGVEVLEIRNPAAMTSGSNTPFDSNNQMAPYQLACVHWVVAQCISDDKTPEAYAAAKFHRSGNLDRPGEYETHIKRLIGNFDLPEDAPTQIKWKPQGGRIGGWGPTKSNPLGGW